MGKNLLIFRIINADGKALAGKGGGFIAVIFGLPHPELEFDALARTIYGAIGHNQRFGLVVLGFVVTGIPDAGKTQKCQPAVTGGGQPGHIRGHIGRRDDHQTLRAGLFCETGVNDAIFIAAFDVLSPEAEKVDAHPCKRPAADGIGHKVKHPVFKRLLDNRRVTDPDNNAGDITLLHPGFHQIRAGCFQGIRKCDRHAAIPVPLVGVQIQLPGSHLLADIFGLVFMDDAPADVGDIDFLPVQSPEPGADIGSDVFKESIDPDFTRTELRPAAVAKSIFNSGSRARGLRARGLKYTPVFSDLIDVLLGCRLVVIFVNLPVAKCLIILSAIFINLGQCLGGIAGVAAVTGPQHVFKYQDKIVLIGQHKASHPHRQPGNGFAIGQGMHLIKVAFIVFRIFFLNEVPAIREGFIIDQSLHPELLMQKGGPNIVHMRFQRRIKRCGFCQQPAPALPIRACGFKALRHCIENGLILRIHRGTLGKAVILMAVSGFIIGKPAQIGQILQTPGLASRTVLLNDAGIF